MLVLSRRLNEKVVLPGLQTTIEVVAIAAGVVRLGIDAPPEVAIVREELKGPNTASAGRRPRPQRPAAEAAPVKPDRQVCERLKVASMGLGMARLQLQAGLVDEVQSSLAQLHDEIQSLRRRLEGEEEMTTRRPPARPRTRPAAQEDRSEHRLLATCLS